MSNRANRNIANEVPTPKETTIDSISNQSGMRLRDQLKEVLSSSGPCITVCIPTAGSPQEEQLRMRHAIAETERLLEQDQTSAEDIQNLLLPIREAAAKWQPGEVRKGGFTMLRSGDLFKVIRLNAPLEASTTVSANFDIRPILRELHAMRSFYILALAQKKVRLLRCTEQSSEEVGLPDGLATDLLSFTNADKPDHNMQSRRSAGPSSGSMKGIVQSTNSDRESKDEYLLHFYKAIDKGLNEVLKGEGNAPVVLAGVDYELALYHKVTTYPNILPDGVHGAPDGLKGGEMHKRALDLIDSQPNPELTRALALYDANIGAGKTSHQVNQVVKSAFEGRVSHLLLADGETQMGQFDDATQKVRQHGSRLPGDEDLLNAAALQTILHDGQVFLAPKEVIPGNAAIAAVLRY